MERFRRFVIRSIATCLIPLFGLGGSAGMGQVAPPTETPTTPARPAPGGDIVEVEAEGKGVTPDEARRDALRAALERGGRTEIFSETQVENFQVMHDTIIARAKGLVTDYKVLKEGPLVGGGYLCRIKARVSKKVLAENWAELQNLLNQIGRPKILVWISERIDEKVQDESLLENKIEERLLKSGFDVVARRGIQEARQRELNDAAGGGNTAAMQAIAKDADAHIFITGTANANHAELGRAYDVPLVFYNCDAEVKMYYTDTGKLLASKGLPNTRGGARGQTQFSPQAGRQALDNVSRELVEAMYNQVMEQWATAISAGGELTLEVENMTFASANRLRKALQELEKIKNVHLDLTRGVARYRINTQLSAQDLAERLSEGEFEKFIEIIDLKLNRIQARPAGSPATQGGATP